jgi:ATP-dependent protease HslVU (ClpYQ) ATPase subunit
MKTDHVLFRVRLCMSKPDLIPGLQGRLPIASAQPLIVGDFVRILPSPMPPCAPVHALLATEGVTEFAESGVQRSPKSPSKSTSEPENTRRLHTVMGACSRA